MTVLFLYSAVILGLASLCGVIAERLEAADRRRRERSERLRARVAAWRMIDEQERSAQ